MRILLTLVLLSATSYSRDLTELPVWEDLRELIGPWGAAEVADGTATGEPWLHVREGHLEADGLWLRTTTHRVHITSSEDGKLVGARVLDDEGRALSTWVLDLKLESGLLWTEEHADNPTRRISQNVGDDGRLKTELVQRSEDGRWALTTRQHQERAEKRVTARDLSFLIPNEWERLDPANSMQVAQLILPSPQEGTKDAALVLYYFGPEGAGGTQANLDRWIAQVTQPDGKPSKDKAKVTEQTSNGLNVHVLEVTGNYIDRRTATTAKNITLWGVIVEAPGGPVYLKAVLPKATHTRWQRSLTRLLQSLAASR